jgi:hypothetical protein
MPQNSQEFGGAPHYLVAGLFSGKLSVPSLNASRFAYHGKESSLWKQRDMHPREVAPFSF